VRVPDVGDDEEDLAELFEQVVRLGPVRSELGETGRRGAVGIADELEQQFGPDQLHRVGDRGADRPESAEDRELR